VKQPPKRTSRKTKLLDKKIVAIGFLLVLFFVAIIILYLVGKKESLSPDQNFIVTVNPVKKTIADDQSRAENKDAQLAREISIKVYEILSDNISSVASLANPSIKHIRVQPGMRKEEIADILAKKLDWDIETENIFLTTRSGVVLDDIKFTEGYYFPTGYSFEKNTPPEVVAEAMISEFKEIAKILGKQGGQKTLKLKGKKHYQKMAEIRWKGKKLPVDKSS